MFCYDPYRILISLPLTPFYLFFFYYKKEYRNQYHENKGTPVDGIKERLSALWRQCTGQPLHTPQPTENSLLVPLPQPASTVITQSENTISTIPTLSP